MSVIYPEIAVANDGVEDPEFPQKCPVCDADVDVELHSKHSFERKIVYECGGTYSLKPQIQNHTNKYWGNCID